MFDILINNMFTNKRKNKGQPIVAIIFDNEFNILFVESNKSYNDFNYEEIKEKNYLLHAEYLCIEKLCEDKKDGKNLNLIITTSPCIKCAKRIKELEFENVYFLFDKFFPSKENLYWKELENIKKLDWENDLFQKETNDKIKKMEKAWKSSIYQNRKKI